MMKLKIKKNTDRRKTISTPRVQNKYNIDGVLSL